MSPLVMILFLLYSTSTRTTIAHQYELQYCTTVQYNRAGGVPVFTWRVLKRGVRGGFPPWLGRGGFEEPKVPPPSSFRRQRTILNIRVMLNISPRGAHPGLVTLRLLSAILRSLLSGGS